MINRNVSVIWIFRKSIKTMPIVKHLLPDLQSTIIPTGNNKSTQVWDTRRQRYSIALLKLNKRPLSIVPTHNNLVFNTGKLINEVIDNC